MSSSNKGQGPYALGVLPTSALLCYTAALKALGTSCDISATLLHRWWLKSVSGLLPFVRVAAAALVFALCPTITR